MKKRVRSRCLLSFFTAMCILLSTGFLFAGERMSVKVSMANIRSGPGKNYRVLWKVEKYHPFEVLKTSGKWCNIRDYEGDEGWVYKSLLSKKKSVIIIKNNVNVRSGPGVKHDIVFTSEKGVPFLVIGKKGKWLHIQHSDGDKGWIYKPLTW